MLKVPDWRFTIAKWRARPKCTSTRLLQITRCETTATFTLSLLGRSRFQVEHRGIGEGVNLAYFNHILLHGEYLAPAFGPTVFGLGSEEGGVLERAGGLGAR